MDRDADRDAGASLADKVAKTEVRHTLSSVKPHAPPTYSQNFRECSHVAQLQIVITAQHGEVEHQLQEGRATLMRFNTELRCLRELYEVIQGEEAGQLPTRSHDQEA